VSFYNFKDAPTDIRSLIHCINLHGNDLIGLELGVFKAESFCTVLQNCPNIKELHGVDFWLPYVDCLKEPYDGTPGYEVDEKSIEFIKLTALHNIKYSGHEDKAFIHIGNSNEVVNNFPDETFDFIFVDTYMTLEQAQKDLELWYPKVKKGGLFTGHDWNSTAIQQAVYEFREKNNIQNTLSTFDNSFIWVK